MSIRKIITIGAPILRQKTKNIDPQELRAADFIILVNDMIDTMRAQKGVGLAAPQIGVDKRLFVAETDSGPIALVNAQITRHSKKLVKFEEGCLSIPEKFEVVQRNHEVGVEALTIEGELIKFTAVGFFARVMQHEIDHLDGILFVDRLAEQKTTNESE
ncbi:peptide deformylase [Patescibacteria group bacterium]|nr:peptide deformylase [Patescibacteria group bacterium]MBU1029283.1 peptide deformylase [Patescibacteria group bacterium]MBU1915906.1 peptide deformylase [Patescibacteria group bacterium]